MVLLDSRALNDAQVGMDGGVNENEVKVSPHKSYFKWDNSTEKNNKELFLVDIISLEIPNIH